MEPLMITASCGFTRLPDAEPRADTVEEVVESVYQCYRAGACIAQVRAPFTVDPKTGQATTNLQTWIDIFKGVRARCDILLHIGVAGGPIDKRIELLKAVRPEISAFLVSHHDIVVRGHDIYQLLLRPDAVRLLRAHVEEGVVPAFEIFHTGALWNLEYCLREVDVPRPLALTLFYWEGGLWAPPTIEELLQRISVLPKDASYTLATAHGPQHTLMHALAIGRGGHVRAGFGDHYPYYTEGVLGQSNAQFVSRMVRLAREMGREIATPDVATKLMGIKRNADGGKH